MKKSVVSAFLLIICLEQWSTSCTPVNHHLTELKENAADLPADAVRRFKRSDIFRVKENSKAREDDNVVCCKLHLVVCCHG